MTEAQSREVSSLDELKDFITENKQYVSRHTSFLKLIDIIKERFPNKPLNIVETGTMRGFKGEWSGGDGASSVIWAKLAKLTGGHFWTVDLSADNINQCKLFTAAYSDWTTYVVSDSIEFLANFDKKIDLLYLDSYDTGGYYQMIAACNHQLNECKAALDKLNYDSIILSDDADQLDAGKVAFSVPFLLENNYKILYHTTEVGQVALSK